VTERDREGVFQGTWEITSSEVWDKEALDLVERAHFRFHGRQGELVMIAVRGWLDCRYGERGDGPAVEFSWEGEDEGDQRCGRGWAVLEPDGKLEGRLFFHMGDDSAFSAMRKQAKKRGSGRSRRRR
jgi:hypothetical protein